MCSLHCKKMIYTGTCITRLLAMQTSWISKPGFTAVAWCICLHRFILNACHVAVSPQQYVIMINYDILLSILVLTIKPDVETRQCCQPFVLINVMTASSSEQGWKICFLFKKGSFPSVFAGELPLYSTVCSTVYFAKANFEECPDPVQIFLQQQNS